MKYIVPGTMTADAANKQFGDRYGVDWEYGQPTGVELIAAERHRQVSVEGWMAEHDDKHQCGEMCSAAHCYLVAADCLANGKELMGPEYHETTDNLKEEIFGHKFGNACAWPWDDDWLKITEDPIRNLVKAGALIAAEIDRLQRKKLAEQEAT